MESIKAQNKQGMTPATIGSQQEREHPKDVLPNLERSLTRISPLDKNTTQIVNNQYEKIKIIGEGAYGHVFVAKDKYNNDNLVALKKLILSDNEKREGFPLTAIREIQQLSDVQSEYVLKLYEICRGSDNIYYEEEVYMVIEYMDCDLSGYGSKIKWKFQTPQVKCIMKQILVGVMALHNNGILHRDLKSANLLLNRHGQLKIADFGLARKFDKKSMKGNYTNRVVTLWYRAPELLLGEVHYGGGIDVWSVGCIFAELLTGTPLFPGNDEAEQLQLILQCFGPPTEDTWPGVSKLPNYKMIKHSAYDSSKKNRPQDVLNQIKNRDEGAYKLINRILIVDPKKRPSCLELVEDDWFWSKPDPCRKEDLGIPDNLIQAYPNLQNQHQQQQHNQQQQQRRTQHNNKRPYAQNNQQHYHGKDDNGTHTNTNKDYHHRDNRQDNRQQQNRQNYNNQQKRFKSDYSNPQQNTNKAFNQNYKQGNKQGKMNNMPHQQPNVSQMQQQQQQQQQFNKFPAQHQNVGPSKMQIPQQPPQPQQYGFQNAFSAQVPPQQLQAPPQPQQMQAHPPVQPPPPQVMPQPQQVMQNVQQQYYRKPNQYGQ